MEQTILPEQVSTVRALQLITVAWITAELCVGVYAGVRAHSIALTAFGADSAIELLSALVVLLRLHLGPATEKRAARTSGVLLYGLAAYILLTSVLSLLNRSPKAEPTLLGIGLLVAAAVIMPLLGQAKKVMAQKTKSRALNADAVQSNICAYLSWIALAGLLLNRYLHLRWADPAAALLLLPIILKEAAEASKGEVCECC